MKFRAYSLVVALVMAILTPYTLAQSNPNPTGTPPVTGTPQTNSQADKADTPAPVDETVPQVANPPKEKHDKSKNDIDAIGNRKVGNGKGLGNWYSLEKEIAMGKEFAAQVESSVKLVQDPVVTEYVNRIGQNLGA